jgi:hypothetical protein
MRRTLRLVSDLLWNQRGPEMISGGNRTRQPKP